LAEQTKRRRSVLREELVKPTFTHRFARTRANWRRNRRRNWRRHAQRPARRRINKDGIRFKNQVGRPTGNRRKRNLNIRGGKGLMIGAMTGMSIRTRNRNILRKTTWRKQIKTGHVVIKWR
jgi:hypothetical protein